MNKDKSYPFFTIYQGYCAYSLYMTASPCGDFCFAPQLSLVYLELVGENVLRLILLFLSTTIIFVPKFSIFYSGL